MDREHAIFQGPFPIELAFGEEETPDHYRHFYSGRDLGATMRTWRVHERDYVNSEGMTPGVVADGWGWEDSPDAEVISGGMNTKGPNAVALGRHGPLFHWGFYADPDDMTDSGRAAFLNAVVYTAGFDRQPLLVRKEARGRGFMLDRAYRLSRMRKGWEESVARTERYNSSVREAKAKLAAGEELTPLEQQYAEREEGAPATWEVYRAEEFDALKQPKLVAKLGTDRPEAYLEYYERNLGYLMPVEGDRWMWHVDEDAKALGYANQDARLLVAAIDALGRDGESAERGRRVLERYTTLKLGEQAAWRAWLAAVESRLFFSDVGGYRWFVGPEHARGGDY